MPDLLAMLANCPKARSVSIYDRCKAVYEGLMAERALFATKAVKFVTRRREGGYGPPFCLEERNTEIDGGLKGSALTLARFPRRPLWTRNM